MLPAVLLLTAVLAASAQELPNPAPAGSGQAYLVTGPGGAIYLSWTERAPSGATTLRYATLDGDRFRPLGAISEGANWFLNWADYPTLLPLPNGGFAAHWLQKSGPSAYSYGVRVAVSSPKGAAWKTIFAPEIPAGEQYSGFVSLVASSKELGAAYLAPGPAGGDHDKALRFARFTLAGAPISDDLVDPDVCTCCQTAAAMTPNGPIVAYRDHEPGELRDISVVAFRNGKWTRARPIHQDGWRINACPVNGPALAVQDDRVTVAWYTAAEDKPRVYAAISTDGGATFGAPVRLDSGAPIGRVAALLEPGGGSIVSWLERKPDGRGELLMRRISPTGRAGEPRLVSPVDLARKTGFPKMALRANSVIFAWTEDRIRTVQAPLGN